MTYKFNVFTGKLDLDTTSAGTPQIPQYENTDPVSPSPGDTWVKHTPLSGGGSPIGLLLGLTYAGSGSETYELSYFTDQSTTIRIEMS